MMGYFFYERDQKIARQLEEIEECIVKAKKMKFLQTDRNRFVNRYSKANHFYVEEILEPLPLLSGESKIVQAMSKEGFFGGSDLIKKRENALVHNRMKFAENKRAEGRGLVETESHLLSKVEVDGDDLKHILSLIEGVYIG
ncbi:MAG: hypothetical protein KBC64_06145, partial [Simkaniaceae bacterium]|nr:hypothetical protein [Simkaniaceae bacterium]